MAVGASVVCKTFKMVCCRLAHGSCASPVCLVVMCVPVRRAQATLAAANVAARLQGLPAWNKPDVLGFVDGPMQDMPKASPNIVNADKLGIETL